MDISHMLQDTAAKASLTGVDGNNDPSYGASTEFRCRIEKKRVRGGGDGEVIDTKDILVTDQVVEDTDIIWLDTSDAGNISKGKMVDDIAIADPRSGGNTVREVVLL